MIQSTRFACISVTFLIVFVGISWSTGHDLFSNNTTSPTLYSKMRTPSAALPKVTQRPYGKTADGKSVTEFTCRNSAGNVMKLITYGATMTSLEIPDRNGKRENIILTCPDLEGFEKCQSYFGGSVGRFCNRIAKGKFSINGQPYELAVNNAPNHLHGGIKGFDKVIWDAKPRETADAAGVYFEYVSADGEEGYPGQLKVSVEYLLTNENEMTVEFRATTNKMTVVNLTNHNYWNLGGHNSGTILDHQLKVEADKFLEVDETLIPTGVLADVVGTPLNFQTFRKMGERLDQVGSDPKGYDHCFAIRDYDGSMRLAAVVKDAKSGRGMEIHTTQPGLQFYTGNFLDGGDGSGGYQQYSAFCLETQHYPDSPNQPDFPSTLLTPGDEYVQKTIHRFFGE